MQGLDATIVAHELDHLDGILYIDKAKKIMDMNKQEREEHRKTHPYKIISKDSK
jgi:peptide deformylase